MGALTMTPSRVVVGVADTTEVVAGKSRVSLTALRLRTLSLLNEAVSSLLLWISCLLSISFSFLHLLLGLLAGTMSMAVEGAGLVTEGAATLEPSSPYQVQCPFVPIALYSAHCYETLTILCSVRLHWRSWSQGSTRRQR